MTLTVSAIALLVGLVWAGGSPQPPSGPLPSSGSATGWGVRGARVLADLLALITVGTLLVRAVLVPSGSKARRAGPAVGPWALAWSVSLGALLLLTVADVVGVPIQRLDLTTLREASSLTRVRGLAISCVTIALLGLLVPRVCTVRGTRALLSVVLLASLPAYATGHATSAPDERLAVAGIVVHVVSALLWTGGLVALVWHLRDHPSLPAAASRYSALALACYVALAASGLATAVFRLGLSSQAWSSGYAALVLTKVALLIGLGLVGHRHRRRTLPRLRVGEPRDFARLAGLELCLMGLAIGLAAALAHTPPPTGPASTHPAMSPSPLPFPVEPFAWWRLATEWRPDMVVLVAVAGVAIQGMRRTTQPVRLVAGLAVLVVATCSGVSTYAPSLLSVQTAQLLLVLVVAPALLAPALPTTCDSHDRWAARVPPVAAAVLGSGLVLGLYRTPVLEASLRSSWVSLGVLLVAVVAGLAVGLTAFDMGRPRSDRLVAGLPVAASMGMLSFQLAAADRLVAVAWFVEIRPDADLVADQRIAALLLGAGAVAVLFGTLQSLGQSRTTTRPSSSVSSTAP